MFAILDQERETSGMETLSQEGGKKVVGERGGTVSWGSGRGGKAESLGWRELLQIDTEYSLLLLLLPVISSNLPEHLS